MATMNEQSVPQEIVDFWFADDTRRRWFNSTAEFDRRLCENYQVLWERASRAELDHWMETAEGCLALVIILDQLPLNMFRGRAQCFATEAQSRDIARIALEKGFDLQLMPDQKAFLYMPFMHSEDLEDQQLALTLFDQPGLESNLRFAHHHYSIVERFGRFPHRNNILGRDSSDAEIEYLNSKEAFNG
ncbi:MAG: DUF924 domain-containing protein [Gammaproteobacteria bacterium]|nr:DUF924 domain-containing protein [Gammaproteobacteria bacterium]